MHFGVSMFHTDYSIPAVELAKALEARGFESMWAPEHSHIPVPRKTPFPGGGELPKPYYEVMDPFVVLSAAAVVTNTATAPAAAQSCQNLFVFMCASFGKSS